MRLIVLLIDLTSMLDLLLFFSVAIKEGPARAGRRTRSHTHSHWRRCELLVHRPAEEEEEALGAPTERHGHGPYLPVSCLQ